MKLKTPEIEGTNKIKLFFIIIVIGAVLGSAAPFVHIIYPKKAQEKTILQEKFDNGKISREDYKEQKEILWEKYQFLGFTNFRRFSYAIGLPIALFICSFSLMFFSRFISDAFIKKGSFIVSLSFQFTALYFILWTIYPFDPEKYDFHISTYYKFLILCSTLLSFGVFLVSKSLAYQKLEIRELISLTVLLRKKLFKNLDKHESITTAAIEKEKVDDRIYDTLEKIID